MGPEWCQGEGCDLKAVKDGAAKPPARRMRTVLAAMLVLPSLLAGCTASGIEDGPGARGGERLPPPLTGLALARHHLNIALGRYSRGAGEAADVAPAAAVRVAKACSGDRPTVTWLGHSSAIIHIGGQCILTDPVLDSRQSAVSPLPQRLVENPIGVDDLPAIDVIVLSHGDFDHLHVPTMNALARRFPKARVLLPPGVAGPVILAGAAHVVRSRPGQATHINGLTITAERAHHETRRNLAALRSGNAFSWVITDGRKKILFIGDTAYGPAFAEIGRSHGPFDLLLVPIGAHEPRELVADMHVDPEEAVRIARDVGARLAIGIHWGTFRLSPERPSETVHRFREAGRETGVEATVLPIGRSVAVP